MVWVTREVESFNDMTGAELSFGLTHDFLRMR
jgi:hypothetical protein